MKNLFQAGKLLLLDLASTFFFLFLYLLTKNITLSVLLGMALGVAQIGWEFARKKPIDTMQWLSLFLVLGAGTATLLTDDPRFVMIKPSMIYCVVGIVMLKRGWMNRYLPPVAIELIPDVATIFGYVWAGPDVPFGSSEPDRGPQLQCHDLVGIHADLRHRQQAGLVPDRLRHHANHRHSPPRPAGGDPFLK